MEVATRLQSSLRTEDTVARLGGDEFIVLSENLRGEQGAAAVAGRIPKALQPPIPLDGHEVLVNTSIGVAFGGAAEDRPEVLLRDAEIATYWVKASGKNRYEIFRQEMGDSSANRLRLEEDLRVPLERGEFVVHYQPKVIIETGRIVGVEALVRWEHPERGLLHQAEFVPLAEGTGLIMPLGRWVLEEACRQVKEWQGRYPSDPPLAVYVNLSTRQLYDPDLVGQVTGVLRDTGLGASSLVLEITEGMETGEAVAELRSLGCNFGQGDYWWTPQPASETATLLDAHLNS